MWIVLGRRVILSLRNFAQEFGLGPMKTADSVNVPSTFIRCFAVLQNNNILCPVNGHSFCQSFRRIFIRPVKLSHPADVPGGEPGNVRVSIGKIFSGGNSGAFLCSGADQLADFSVQLHLRQFSRHQSVQRREHGTVVYRLPDVHEFLLSGAVRHFYFILFAVSQTEAQQWIIGLTA